MGSDRDARRHEVARESERRIGSAVDRVRSAAAAAERALRRPSLGGRGTARSPKRSCGSSRPRRAPRSPEAGAELSRVASTHAQFERGRHRPRQVAPRCDARVTSGLMTGGYSGLWRGATRLRGAASREAHELRPEHGAVHVVRARPRAGFARRAASTVRAHHGEIEARSGAAIAVRDARCARRFRGGGRAAGDRDDHSDASHQKFTHVAAPARGVPRSRAARDGPAAQMPRSEPRLGAARR